MMIEAKQTAETLWLKWGTLKGWDLHTEASRAAAQAYLDSGIPISVMLRRDTPDQKALLCTLIDTIDGTIINDWTGKIMSKDEAKDYVREYKTP